MKKFIIIGVIVIVVVVAAILIVKKMKKSSVENPPVTDGGKTDAGGKVIAFTNPNSQGAGASVLKEGELIWGKGDGAVSGVTIM